MARGGGVDDEDNDGRRNDNRANVVAYNAVVSAWAKSARGRAPGDGGSSCRTIAPTQAKISSSRSAAENAELLLLLLLLQLLMGHNSILSQLGATTATTRPALVLNDVPL